MGGIGNEPPDVGGDTIVYMVAAWEGGWLSRFLDGASRYRHSRPPLKGELARAHVS